jgi:hypothetical protein
MVYMYVTLLCSATKGENMHIQWHIKLCVDVATVPHPTGSPTLRPSASPPSSALQSRKVSRRCWYWQDQWQQQVFFRIMSTDAAAQKENDQVVLLAT